MTKLPLSKLRNIDNKKTSKNGIENQMHQNPTKFHCFRFGRTLKKKKANKARNIKSSINNIAFKGESRNGNKSLIC